MGQKDITEKVLEDYNDVFADIINGLLFDGVQEIKPEDLENTTVHAQYKAEDGKVHELERDIAINLCGYAFLRAYPDGKINGKEFIPDEKISSYIESRINSNDSMADKAEVFRTNCLKEFPFPEYPGERFLGEDIVWVRMARKYMMVHINKAIYIGNYLEDGLTKNRRLNNIKSPVGCMNRAREFMKPDINNKYRVKATLQHIIYGRFASVSVVGIIGDSPDKKLTLICLIPGLILQKIWKRKFVPKR